VTNAVATTVVQIWRMAVVVVMVFMAVCLSEGFRRNPYHHVRSVPGAVDGT